MNTLTAMFDSFQIEIDQAIEAHLEEGAYCTPQELVADCTEQLSRQYHMAEQLADNEVDDLDEETLFDLIVGLPVCEDALVNDDEFTATYLHFLNLERQQENLVFVVNAVFAA